VLKVCGAESKEELPSIVIFGLTGDIKSGWEMSAIAVPEARWGILFNSVTYS